MNKFGNTEVWGDLYINGEKVKDVATTGSYDDLTGTPDLSVKADKVSGATSGNFAGLDANGNLTDSGKKASDFANTGNYGVCDTAASTTAKEVTIQGYTLQVGVPVVVKFTNNVPDNATLNINSTGAKPIFVNGVAVISGKIIANETITLIYDGTNYIYISSDKLTNAKNGRGSNSIHSMELGDSAFAGGTGGSLAIGPSAQALNGNGALAVGNSTVANGFGVISVGHTNNVATSYAGAIGQGNQVSRGYSVAIGRYNTIEKNSQFAFGEFNEIDTSTNSRGTYYGNLIEIVGNGTDANNRSNARTLDWQGNEVLAGSISATSAIVSGQSIVWDSDNQCLKVIFS